MGIGPKKAAEFVNKYNITSIKDLLKHHNANIINLSKLTLLDIKYFYPQLKSNIARILKDKEPINYKKIPRSEIDLININLDIIKEHPDRKYYSFINSIEYVKKKYSIMSKKYDNYGLYVTLKNGIDDKLTKNENDFIYNAIIPDYCYYSIDYQCDYYEIIFTYLSENKKDMNKFINKYYINTTHAFVSDIELIIEE